MKAKLHPADIADRALIAEAIEFTAFLRLGPFDKIVERAATLSEAAAKAEAIAAAHKGRAALVYAVLADGRSIPVPMDMRKSALVPSKETKTMTTKPLSAIDIAKLTAIITGSGYKRSNCRDTAAKRFIKIAGEAGIPVEKATDYLRGPFDMVEHVISEHVAGKPMTVAEVRATPAAGKPVASIHVEQAFGGDPLGTKAAKNGSHRRTVLAVVKSKKATPKEAAKEKAERKRPGKRTAILEAAQAGKLPPVPDFSAPTHARFRKKLDEVVASANAGDLKGLKGYAINPVSSSPKAIARYRDLAVIALEARKAGKAAA